MINFVLAYLTAKNNSDKGATAVEYGLMVALIAAVIILAVGLLGGRLTAIFTAVTAGI